MIESMGIKHPIQIAYILKFRESFANEIDHLYVGVHPSESHENRLPADTECNVIEALDDHLEYIPAFDNHPGNKQIKEDTLPRVSNTYYQGNDIKNDQIQQLLTLAED